MKLQSKVLLILASIWFVLCAIVYIDSKLTIEKSYKNIEQKYAKKDVRRAVKALDQAFSKLELFTTTYAIWDEQYSFMQHINQQFIDINFTPAVFTSANINFYILLTNKGQLYYGANYDLTKNKFVPVPQDLITLAGPLAVNQSVDSKRCGFLKVSQELTVICVLPVLTSHEKGPVYGSVLMGYWMHDSKLLANISKSIEMHASIFPLPLMTNDLEVRTAYENLVTDKSPYISYYSSTLLHGFIFINDVYGKPVAILKIDIPREVYKETVFSMYYYLALILVFGIVILITMWVLLKILILDRILNISKQVIEINNTASFNSRISISGTDELKDMTNAINSMLQLIEMTQEQLKYRISRRTKDLEKLSSLNRNLFSEMSKQRSIEAKLREDEKVLRQMAYYDSLTGLPNRAFFNELLLKAIAAADKQDTKVAILFLDINKFKKINDTYGHDFADKILKTVATRLKETINVNDVVARIGGDEFILFLNVPDRNDIDKIVENIFVELSKTIIINDINITPTFSMGISIYPEDGRTMDEVLSRADLSMYHAKKHDGNTFYYYSSIEKVTTHSQT